MLKSRKDQVLLPLVNEGTATHPEETGRKIDCLLDNAEKSLEIDDESRKLQQMSEDAKELNRSAETNLEALATAVDQFNDAKTSLETATKSASKVADNINDAVSNAKKATIQVGFSDETKKYLGEQHKAYLEEEAKLMESHRQKMKKLLEEHQNEMRKIAKSSGGFYLTGWTAKLGIGSWVFLYIFFCITMMWLGTR